jgi:hypothetical protein
MGIEEAEALKGSEDDDDMTRRSMEARDGK